MHTVLNKKIDDQQSRHDEELAQLKEVLNNKIDNQAREITALQVENNAMKSQIASLQLRLDSVSKMTGPIGPTGPKGERGLNFQLVG